MDHLLYSQEYNLYIGSYNNTSIGIEPADMLQAMQTAIELRADMHACFEVAFWIAEGKYTLLPELNYQSGSSLEEVLRTGQKAIKYHYPSGSSIMISMRRSASFPFLCELRDIATDEIKSKALCKDLPDVQIAIYRFFPDEFEDIGYLTILKDWNIYYACEI